jgi:hypothetical protein
VKNSISTPTNARFRLQSCYAHAYPVGSRQGKKHVDLVSFDMQKITGHRKGLLSISTNMIATLQAYHGVSSNIGCEMKPLPLCEYKMGGQACGDARK